MYSSFSRAKRSRSSLALSSHTLRSSADRLFHLVPFSLRPLAPESDQDRPLNRPKGDWPRSGRVQTGYRPGPGAVAKLAHVKVGRTRWGVTGASCGGAFPLTYSETLWGDTVGGRKGATRGRCPRCIGWGGHDAHSAQVAALNSGKQLCRARQLRAPPSVAALNCIGALSTQSQAFTSVAAQLQAFTSVAGLCLSSAPTSGTQRLPLATISPPFLARTQLKPSAAPLPCAARRSVLRVTLSATHGQGHPFTQFATQRSVRPFHSVPRSTLSATLGADPRPLGSAALKRDAQVAVLPWAASHSVRHLG